MIVFGIDRFRSLLVCVVVVVMGVVCASRARACGDESAQELLNVVRLLPELHLQLEKYNNNDTAVEALRRTVDVLRAERGMQAKEVRAAQDEAAAAREELGRWWRSPFVWLSVGALVGALAGIAIAH